MDILLIQPKKPIASSLLVKQREFIPPMMLLYLANPLVEKGFSVDILDLTVYNINARRFCDYVRINRPAIVGITCTSAAFSNALRAACYIKSVDPKIKVVIGGPHVTFQSKEALTYDCFDIVVRGEGDINFPQLAEHFIHGHHSLAEIKGISYRSNGDIIENPGQVIEDINILSYPRRKLLNISRYLTPGIIHASRGCPFKCHFCAAGAMYGGKHRMRSPESILEELDYLVRQMGIDYITFLDDTITVFQELMEQICRYILDKKYSLRWTCESRVDVTNRGLLKLMASAGCFAIGFGFESGSETILNSINKIITPRQIEDTVSLCMEIGITPYGCFMIGLPEDTRETVNETIRLAKKIKKIGAEVTVAVFTPFPGTYFYNHARELGITIHTQNWDYYDLEHSIISTKYFSHDELRAISFDLKMELHNHH